MMDVLQAQNLKPLYGIRHAFLGRNGGVSADIYESLNCGQSSADEPGAVAENRRLVALYLEIPPENLLSCKQVHSPLAVIVKEPWLPQDRPEADAMVTREQGVALGILTADCVPVLFADERAGVVGAAHAGWRGALGGVIENTIAAMETLGAERSRIATALGPCIWQDSYEVGPEFPEAFLKENPEHRQFFRGGNRTGYTMFNLPAYVEGKLRASGVASVEPSPADTCADEARFFSYRRNTLRGEKRAGSLLSTIMRIGACPPRPHDDTLEAIEREALGRYRMSGGSSLF